MELKDVRANDTLTLASDPDFRGYVVGVLELREPGPIQLLMVIAKPGKTGKTGHRPFPLADLVPAPVGRGK